MTNLSGSADLQIASVKRFSQLSSGELTFWRDSVALNSRYQRAFLTATFFEAVAKIDETARVLVIYGGGELIGLLPLRRHRSWVGRFGVYEPVAGQMTDYFGAIVAPGVVLDIQKILTIAGVGAIVFTHLDESQTAIGLRGDGTRIGLRTVIAGTGNTHWEQLRTVDKKLVADTERRERKLIAEHGDLNFELQSTSPEEDLDELIRLKKAQYTRTGKQDAVLFDESNSALLKGLLQSTALDCTGFLSVLRVNGKLVAAHFGLRCNDVLHFWFPVYAKEYSAFSPGRILYRYILNEGSKVGIRVLDRGEGDTQAKRDFANEEHHFYDGLWQSNSVLGLVARLALATYWRI